MTAIGVRSLAVGSVPCAVYGVPFNRELEHDHEIVSSIDFSRRLVI